MLGQPDSTKQTPKHGITAPLAAGEGDVQRWAEMLEDNSRLIRLEVIRTIIRDQAEQARARDPAATASQI